MNDAQLMYPISNGHQMGQKSQKICMQRDEFTDTSAPEDNRDSRDKLIYWNASVA